jgi:CysZ protein
MTEPQNPEPISPQKRSPRGFGLIAGATYPFRTLIFLLQNPKLLQYVVIPILVNFITGILLYLGLLLPGLNQIDALVRGLSGWIESLIANLPPWLGALTMIAVAIGWLLRLVLVAGLLILIGLLVLQIGSILGAPWYGQLSEQIEKLRTGQLPPMAEGMGALLRDIWRALMFEIKKLLFAGGFGILLFLLNFFIPIGGTVVATIIGVGVAATLVCLDFFDGPLERRRLSFRQKLKIVFGHLPASGSFALVCLFLISVPVLNLLVIPICVASGTLFFCDLVWPNLLINNPESQEPK